MKLFLQPLLGTQLTVSWGLTPMGNYLPSVLIRQHKSDTLRSKPGLVSHRCSNPPYHCLMSNQAFQLLKTKWAQFFPPTLHAQVMLFPPSKYIWNQMAYDHFCGLWPVCHLSPGDLQASRGISWQIPPWILSTSLSTTASMTLTWALALAQTHSDSSLFQVTVTPACVTVC